MAIRPAAQLRVDISPADVGRRISVRYRPDGIGAATSEAVGVLDRWTGTGKHGVLRLRRRDGMTIGIEAGTLAAARVVPPEVSAYALQRVSQRGWPPVVGEFLGDWEMRWSGGATGRANSVRVGGEPGMSIRHALHRVTEWYAERGAAPLLQLPTPSAHDATYDSHGWHIVRGVRVLTNSTPRLLDVTGVAAARTDLTLSIDDAPDPQWFALVRGYSDETAEEFAHVMRPGPSTAFVSCRKSDTGELVAIGRAAITAEWAAVTSMETVEHVRRRGIATAVMSALVRWGADRGAERWFLQVYSVNSAALTFYDALGFTPHHEYVYRAPDALQPD